MAREAIICVDDESFILLSLKQIVKDYFGDRYICETALNADDAVSVIDDLSREGIRTALIVTDWLMPRKKGDELIAEAAEKFPGIKGIVITGHVDRDSLERLQISNDIVAFVSKPWKTEELIKTMNSALSK